ncbi:MAG: hypothetical protein ACJ8AG_29925 [Ktedonobacteraceae bacterium]
MLGGGALADARPHGEPLEAPSGSDLAKGQTASERSRDKGGSAGAPQDIQEPEAAQPKEALVAPVLPIKTVALPMMDTGSGQMHDPPHGHKHRQEQPTRPFAISNQAGFQIPVTALGILEDCGLSACARHIPARVAALLADRK